MKTLTQEEIDGVATQPELPGIEPAAPALSPMEASEMQFRLERLRGDLDLIPIELVSLLLNAKEQTLAGWRSMGLGPKYVKLGKNVFYRREDLKEWINENIVDPAEHKEAA